MASGHLQLCRKVRSNAGVSTMCDCWLRTLCPSSRRAYLAVVASNGGQELNLLLPSVVTILNAIYEGILDAVQQVSTLSQARPEDALCNKRVASHSPTHIWLSTDP